MLKHGILGLLNYGDMTGYEIMEAFRDSLNFFWSANTSQIYRELQTLKEKGFVNNRLVEQSSRPDKKIFSITEEGKEELLNWLREEKTNKKTNFPILMKLFFAGEMNTEECISQLETIKLECEEQKSGINLASEKAVSYKDSVNNSKVTRFWDMTMDFGVRYSEMLSDWCNQCISILKKEDK